MSRSDEPPSSSGEHRHDHDHDHGHDHDHDHGHDHDHDHDRDEPKASPPPENFESDDAGTRALADALRSSFVIVKVAMVVMAAVFCFSGVFVVKPQEQAVIFRFGRLVGPPDKQLLGPGLHFAFPPPIDEVDKIPTTEIQTVLSTVGWYSVSREQDALGTDPPFGAELNPATEGYTLTGDGNIIHVRATLRYLIKDPRAYRFNFVDAGNIVQNILNNALFHASSRYPVDRALDVVTLKDAIYKKVSEEALALGLGIEVQPPDVRVRAPLQVKDAFQAVVTASQKKDSAINSARGYANNVLTKAMGESNTVVNLGNTDRVRLLSDLESEANQVTNLLSAYRNNGRLFYERQLADTMQRVMTNAQEKYYLPALTDGARRELRLLLSKSPQQAAPAPEPSEPGIGVGGK